jgi:hypothetical protein
VIKMLKDTYGGGGNCGAAAASSARPKRGIAKSRLESFESCIIELFCVEMVYLIAERESLATINPSRRGCFYRIWTGASQPVFP